MNFGARFVMQDDDKARSNWRFPTERVAGPAVNAGRVIDSRAWVYRPEKAMDLRVCVRACAVDRNGLAGSAEKD